MKNKVLSLLMICLIYIAAIAAGAAMLFSLKRVIDSPIFNMLIADIFATFIVYIFSVIFDNASVYDPYWSVMPIFIVLGYYVCYNISFHFHHLLVLLPLALWSIRLTSNWIINFKDMKWQDWRYIKLKKNYQKYYQLICFFGIMLMPTLLVFCGSIPLWFFINSETFSAVHIVSCIIILSAITLQTAADYQMRKFKREKIEGTCIDKGVWRLSRHPNYFGEISVWWGVAVSALGGASSIIILLETLAVVYYILVFLGAVSITLMFIFISIPLMEKHVQELKPAYKEYKKTVCSPLIPFFRKKK